MSARALMKYFFCISATSVAILAWSSLGGMTKGRAENAVALMLDSAAVPFYPQEARIARQSGTVSIRASTDGTHVTEVTSMEGPGILARAAAANVRTWVFKQHSPVSFRTIFQYTILSDVDCDMDNGTVLLKLPSRVEITVKGWQTCDPVIIRAPR